MNLHRDRDARLAAIGGGVTIGNFDGVHRGHQALLKAARAAATPLVVVTFEPMPARYFNPDRAPPRITGPGERLRLLAAQGVDAVWQMRFNRELAELSADSFLQRMAAGARPAAIVVGHDFRYGRDRQGDARSLRAWCGTHGVDCRVLPPVELDGERISSTRIRTCLAAGDFTTAARLLGRPYAIRGRVTHGRRLGRRLGFPTANLPLRRRAPVHGIFAARVAWGPEAGQNRCRDAVVSVGTRPTIKGRDWLLEAHLFDFDGNLYGQSLEVTFVARIREERHFASLEAMTEQMRRDAAAARAALAARGADARTSTD